MFCKKCTILNIELIEKQESFYCPGCSTKIIKTAQFGGQGVGMPGSYKGMPNWYNSAKSVQFNKFPDQGIDAFFEQVRKNDNYNDDSTETKLSNQHVYYTEDMIPYQLTVKERHQLKKDDIEKRRKRFYEELKDLVDKNSVEYIKENFPTPQEQLTSYENLLNHKRQNQTDINHSEPAHLEAEWNYLDKSQFQKQAQIRVRGPRTVFRSEDMPNDSETLINKEQMHLPPQEGFINNRAWADSEEGLENLLKDGFEDNYGFIAHMSPHRIDYVLPQEDYHPTNISFIRDTTPAIQSKDSDSMEKRLENLSKQQQPDSLPNPYTQFVWTEKTLDNKNGHSDFTENPLPDNSLPGNYTGLYKPLMR